MGKRKRERAEAIKQDRSERSFAYLRNCPISPRKVRLVADMVRGVSVDQALGMLRYSTQGSVKYIEKLLLSAVNNWEQKHTEFQADSSGLFIKYITVDEGRTLKRIRPRAQGRAYRINKRSCHVMIELGDTLNQEQAVDESAPAKEETVNE